MQYNLTEIQAEIARRDLSRFIKEAWMVVEPSTVYQHNWHIDMISEYLLAITMGELRNVIFNIAPRHMKSRQISTFWPAWEWIDDPAMRYLFSSYAIDLARDHSRERRLIIESEWYQERWGDNFKLTTDQNQVTYFANDKGGRMQARGTSGVGTGKGGNRIICFPYDELVNIGNESVKIGELVEKKLQLEIPSYNIQTKEIENKKIVNWYENPSSEIIEVGFDDGATIRCTPNHKIWTENRGWVEAQYLYASDVLPRFTRSNIINGCTANIKLISQNFIRVKAVKNFQNMTFFKFRAKNIRSNNSIIVLNKAFGYIDPCSSLPNSINSVNSDSVFLSKNVRPIRRFHDINNFFFVQFCRGSVFMQRKGAVSLRVINILGASTISKITKSIVRRVTIQMANINPFLLATDKSPHHCLMNINPFRFSIFTRIKSSVPFTIIGCFKDFFFKAIRMTALINNSFLATNAAKTRNTIQIFKAGYKKPLFIRHAGYSDKTYCIEVEDNHNIFMGESQPTLVSNCDDPHNTKQAESQKQRESAIIDFHQNLMTRLDNPKTGSIVLVMQRLNAGDLTGDILKNIGGFEHVKIPSISQKKTIVMFPRSKKMIEREKGDLLWEERMGQKELDIAKKALGTYGFNAQHLQEPVPEGGNRIKSSWFPRYRVIPANPMRVIQSWDTGNKPKDTAAPSVGLTFVYDGEKWLLVDVFKRQMGYPELKRIVRLLAEKWMPQAVLIEDKASGISLIQDLKADGGISVIPIEPEADKITRMETQSPHLEAGQVALPESAPWLGDFETEILRFPEPETWDQIDALSQFLKYTLGKKKVIQMQELDGF